MSFFLDEIENDLWTYLKSAQKKIVLYGMGDGAEKIKSVLDGREIPVADIIASDGFVRGQSFLGYRVKTLAEVEQEYGDGFLILVCFGSQIPEVMEHIRKVAEKHELYAPNVPVAGEGLFDLEYAKAHSAELQTAYNLLAVSKSKEVFEGIVRYRLSGYINILKDIETSADEKYYLLNIGTNEIYVDLGAYDGDTMVEFLNETTMQFKKLYAMEPDVRNYRRMKRKLYMIGSALLECYNCGAWHEDTSLVFSTKRGRGSRPEVRENTSGKPIRSARVSEIKMMKVDTMLQGQPASYIKFDVEGAEENAIKGAEKTITEFKPKLNVAVYHRNEDLFKLPIMINKMNKRYKLYLRHHPYIPDWDTNLYCV